MPKSKRNKVVSLTKVKSKGREGKEELVDKVQECIEKYDNSYVINFENMRSGPFKMVQNQMTDTSKFFLGKNKVMIKALGKFPEDETADNTAQVSKYLSGQVALLFSNLSMKELEKKFGE